jgi:hypothetical protein
METITVKELIDRLKGLQEKYGEDIEVRYAGAAIVGVEYVEGGCLPNDDPNDPIPARLDLYV